LEPRTIELDDTKLVIKKYKVRRTGARGKTLETSIPREAFEREARRMGISLEEAPDILDAVWRYNSFAGLHLSFEIKDEFKAETQTET